jgi:hypothetical protein
MPNALIYMTIEEKDDEGSGMIMKISGVFADARCELNPIK